MASKTSNKRKRSTFKKSSGTHLRARAFRRSDGTVVHRQGGGWGHILNGCKCKADRGLYGSLY